MPRALQRTWGGGLFLMSEVPLYPCTARSRHARCLDIQGHLAHKKTPPPSTLQKACSQGPVMVPRGGAFSYERGTPVHVLHVLEDVDTHHPRVRQWTYAHGPMVTLQYRDTWVKRS